MSGAPGHRILLTGSFGFLASQVRDEIVRDSSCEGLFLSHITQPTYEISMAASHPLSHQVREAILAFRPNCVLNLAWAKVARSEREDPLHMNENVQASRNLFAFVAEHFPSCRLIGIGSQAELGATAAAIRPDSTGVPTSAYGKGKSMARDLLLSAHPETGAWLRLLTLYGPNDHEEKFIPYLLNCLHSGSDAEISPGDQRWDFLHVSDAARALVAAVKAPLLAGIQVVASEEAWELKRVAQFLFDNAPSSSRRPALRIGARPYASSELMRLEGDSGSFRRATGWSPRISLEAGLLELLERNL